MATVTMNYASAAAFTITATGLTNTSKRESTVVSNTSDKFVDVLVTGMCQATAATTSVGYLDVFAYTWVDGGSVYTADATGSNAAYSGESKNLAFLGRIAVESTTARMEGGPWSLRAAFGGSMPEKFGIVIDNETGQDLTAGGTNDNDWYYQGIKYDSA